MLKFTILLSLVLHTVFGIILFYRWKDPVPLKRGVVDVEFIHVSSHQPEVGSTEKEKESLIQKKNTTSGPIGDPAAKGLASNQYIEQVTRLVSQHKIYPKAALDREEEGKVMIAVTLSKEGKVIEFQVEEPSPFELLNQAALKTIQSIPNFPPLPDLIEAPLHLHIPLVFKLERH